MSGGNFSVVAQLKRVINKLPTGRSEVREECEEPQGLVTLPDSETDVQIRDIPVVTQEGVGLAGPDMPCGYLASACSSPDTGCSQPSREPMRGLAKTRVTAIMEENVHLREMLVSQLDLIQQQSETILSKDKQLRQLREENSLLVQRLSRMERRCRPGDTGQPASGTEKRSLVLSPGGPGKKRGRDPEASTPSESALKKRKGEETTSWSEHQRSCVGGVMDCVGPPDDELTDEIMGDIMSASRPDTPVSVASVDNLQSGSNGVKQNKKSKKNSFEGKRKSLSGKSNNDGANEKEAKAKFKSQASVPAPDTYITQETKSLYYVGCRNDVLPNVDDHLDEVAALQRGVEVPCFREDKSHYTQFVSNNKLCFKKDREKAKEDKTWRIKSTNPIYTGSSQGAEDISDQAFLKRHDKFEKEEKQRKRWDLQRLREEQQLQKLRARQEKHIVGGMTGGQMRRKEDTSLLPFIESAKYVQVTEDIPVAAFGRPLPDLPQTTFTLPWVKTSRHSL